MPRREWIPPPKQQVPPFRPPSGVRHFTHYWANDTWDQNSHLEGKPLRHTAGNLFHSRGVAVGDYVYVVTVMSGRLLLLGRIEVGAILGQDQAEAALGGVLWDADDHIIAKAGSENPRRFRREVSIEVAKGLRFLGGEGPARTPQLDSNDSLDRQTMRGVRELTASSAALLDSLIR